MTEVEKIRTHAKDPKYPLSSTLLDVIEFAQDNNDSDFEKWATNEHEGYSNLEDAPEYRRVSGCFTNSVGVKIIDRDENIITYKLKIGFPVAQLENFALQEWVRLGKQEYDEYCSDKGDIEIDNVQFEFHSSYFQKIFSRIRLEILNRVKGKAPAGDTAQSADEKPVEANKCHDDLIRQFNVSYESDNEIIIKEPKKNWKSYTFESIFGKSTKIKDDFLDILKSSNLTYSLGPAHTHSKDGTKTIRVRNKEYGAKKKRLEKMNEKLICFFNKMFSLEIPEDFKLYELCVGQPGTYSFKIVVRNDLRKVKSVSKDTYKDFGKAEILKEIKELSQDKYSNNVDNADQLKNATDHAKRIGITNSELEEHFKLTMPEEDNRHYNPQDDKKNSDNYTPENNPKPLDFT